MESKREQALVGLFVLVAAGLLIVTVFLLSGTLQPAATFPTAPISRMRAA